MFENDDDESNMKTFWVLTAENQLYQDKAADLQILIDRFKPANYGSPLDCEFCILPEQRVYMAYWTCANTGHRPAHSINITATRILADRSLLDTPVPAPKLRWMIASDDEMEIQRAFRLCAPHGNVVLFKVDEQEQLVDYPLATLRSHWHLFFVEDHPCTNRQFDDFFARTFYCAARRRSVREFIVQSILGEPLVDTVSQRQRAERVLLAHHLFAQNPDAWLKLNKFDEAIAVYVLKTA